MMKQALGLAFISFLLFSKTAAQTRFYISVGTNSNVEYVTEPNFNLGFSNNAITTGGHFDDQSFGKYNMFDVHLEKRLFGSLYLVTGGSYFQTGYSWSGDFFSSELKSSYAGIPLLLRFNLYNANVYYLDMGFLGTYLLKAKLTETYDQDRASGNIARHLTRFSPSYLFQFNVVINRVVLTAYSIIKVPGTADDFSSDWELSRNQSVFLIYWREYYFKAGGLKLSYRLR
jgi:hypothetical protein